MSLCTCKTCGCYFANLETAACPACYKAAVSYGEQIVAIVGEELATWGRLHEEAVRRMAPNSGEHATAWHAIASVQRRITSLKNPAQGESAAAKAVK